MFKQKSEEFKVVQEKHFKEIDDQVLLQENAKIFFTTSFYHKLPPDLKEYIFPFVTNAWFYSYCFEKYKEMFGVIGNYLYTPDLNKKNAKFIVQNQDI